MASLLVVACWSGCRDRWGVCALAGVAFGSCGRERCFCPAVQSPYREPGCAEPHGGCQVAVRTRSLALRVCCSPLTSRPRVTPRSRCGGAVGRATRRGARPSGFVPCGPSRDRGCIGHLRMVRVAGRVPCKGRVVFAHDALQEPRAPTGTLVAPFVTWWSSTASFHDAIGYGPRSLNPTSGARVKQNGQVRGGASRRRVEKAQGRKVPGEASPGLPDSAG